MFTVELLPAIRWFGRNEHILFGLVSSSLLPRDDLGDGVGAVSSLVLLPPPPPPLFLPLPKISLRGSSSEESTSTSEPNDPDPPFLCLDDITTPVVAAATVVIAEVVLIVTQVVVVVVVVVVVPEANVLLVPDESKVFLSTTSGDVIKLLVDFLSWYSSRPIHAFISSTVFSEHFLLLGLGIGVSS